MGCDIHAWIEVDKFGDESYSAAAQLFLDRDYNLFARMADVRNHINGRELEPIAMPRGIPDGIDYYRTKDDIEEWGLDGHSHSWLSFAEIQILVQVHHTEDVKAIYAMMASFEKDGYKPRLVFWFDN